MKYIYIPDSYNKKLIEEKFDEEEFVELQNKYRHEIENVIKKIIDFKKLDEEIEKEIKVPVIDDMDINYYHKFSSLDSKFIFLRNNFHIEKLTDDELQVLKEGKVDSDFLNKTFSRVLFEDGDETFYGTPRLENLASSKGIVFDFAYNQMDLIEIEELFKIEEIIKTKSEFIKEQLSKYFSCPISIITFDGIANPFKTDEQRSEEFNKLFS